HDEKTNAEAQKSDAHDISANFEGVKYEKEGNRCEKKGDMYKMDDVRWENREVLCLCALC
ncbi:MAG: hypothetical protein J1F13_01700, partial [Prevotellaceae bacterium]|nr:hypothetical protein [Prevotellaceae bacterium]